MKKTMIIALSAALVISLYACSSVQSKTDGSPESTVSQTDESSKKDIDSQVSADNPVKEYEGTYQHDRVSITIQAIGENEAEITVHWSSSAWEVTTWEMSGLFDPSVFRVDYGDGVKTNYVYDDNGEVTSKEVVYDDSMGRIQFHDKETLVWRDENEQDNGEMTFTKLRNEE